MLWSCLKGSAHSLPISLCVCLTRRAWRILLLNRWRQNSSDTILLLQWLLRLRILIHFRLQGINLILNFLLSGIQIIRILALNGRNSCHSGHSRHVWYLARFCLIQTSSRTILIWLHWAWFFDSILHLHLCYFFKVFLNLNLLFFESHFFDLLGLLVILTLVLVKVLFLLYRLRLWQYLHIFRTRFHNVLHL